DQTINSAVGTYSAVIISGSGTKTTGGNLTATNGLTVTGGTLLIDHSVTGSVTVNGGTLGGTGSVSGMVTINSGTLDPGDAGGTESLAMGALTFASGTSSIYAVQLNGTTAGATSNGYDQDIVTGAVS